MDDVIGWRIDDVVEQIRGTKDTQVRLDVIPAEAGARRQADAHRADARQDPPGRAGRQGRDHHRAGADGDAPAQRIGVIKLPAFYQDFEGRRKNADDYASATRDVAKLLAQLQGAEGRRRGARPAQQRRRFAGRSGRTHRPVHRQGPGGAGARIRRPRQRRTATARRRGMGRPAGGADQSRFGFGVGNLRRRDPGLRPRPGHRRDHLRQGHRAEPGRPRPLAGQRSASASARSS